MVTLESLKKSNQFKKALKEKKIHCEYFSIFAAKNFYKPQYKASLIISFVMKKKIGNAVKRNKIRRKLKAIVQKLLKKRGAINRNYTYIVFGKTKSYVEKTDKLTEIMIKSFKKINSNIEKLKPIQRVNIVAVSKTFSFDHIKPLLDHGHNHFGENKVQEAISKWRQIKKERENLQLHMIGKLQSNKAKNAALLFDYIHSLDNQKLADILSNFENENGKKRERKENEKKMTKKIREYEIFMI